MDDNRIVAVVGKEMFPQRMHIEKEFGEILYDQLIFALEHIGTEVRQGHIDLRLGVYLDTKNDDVRKFSVTSEQEKKIWELFGHNFHKQLKEYSLREQKKGTDILFQLNSGSISMKDFNERL